MELLLLILAYVLKLILFPIGVLLTIIVLLSNPKTFFKELFKWFREIAVAIDKLGNVVLQHPLNAWFIQPVGIKFGDIKNTISAIFGLNKKAGTLKPIGKKVCDVLNSFDSNHVEKAAELNKLNIFTEKTNL